MSRLPSFSFPLTQHLNYYISIVHPSSFRMARRNTISVGFPIHGMLLVCREAIVGTFMWLVDIMSGTNTCTMAATVLRE
jgi:hypothetical protein